jgi:hypothetical protein
MGLTTLSDQYQIRQFIIFLDVPVNTDSKCTLTTTLTEYTFITEGSKITELVKENNTNTQ